jgi:hypothetical protein
MIYRKKRALQQPVVKGRDKTKLLFVAEILQLTGNGW